MSNRRRQKAIVFISAIAKLAVGIAIIAVLTAAIANLPNDKAAYSLWQYNWGKSYQRVISSLGSEEEWIMEFLFSSSMKNF